MAVKVYDFDFCDMSRHMPDNFMRIIEGKIKAENYVLVDKELDLIEEYMPEKALDNAYLHCFGRSVPVNKRVHISIRLDDGHKICLGRRLSPHYALTPSRTKKKHIHRSLVNITHIASGMAIVRNLTHSQALDFWHNLPKQLRISIENDNIETVVHTGVIDHTKGFKSKLNGGYYENRKAVA